MTDIVLNSNETIQMLSQKPPFVRGEDTCLLNTEALVNRLWRLLK